MVTGSESRSSQEFLLIAPTRGWIPLRLSDLWEYRELLFFLAWRDISVRYKQTVLGISWAIIQPFATMVVFSLFFGNLAQISSDGIPYPIFSYAALVPWTFFSTGITNASGSLVSSANMIKKIYFPRTVLPIAAILACVVDFLLAFIVLIGMILYFKVQVSINVLALPIFFSLAFITALGVSFWLAAMNVQFRDVKYLIPFLTQLWMFLTPVVYPASLIRDPILRAVYGLNPMVGVIEGFRWSLLQSGGGPDITLWVSVVISVVILISGMFYFRRMERTFADVA